MTRCDWGSGYGVPKLLLECINTLGLFVIQGVLFSDVGLAPSSSATATETVTTTVTATTTTLVSKRPRSESGHDDSLCDNDVTDAAVFKHARVDAASTVNDVSESKKEGTNGWFFAINGYRT